MKLGGYFLLVKRLFINIFFILPYCYKEMKFATPFQFFIRTFECLYEKSLLIFNKESSKIFHILKYKKLKMLKMGLKYYEKI